MEASLDETSARGSVGGRVSIEHCLQKDSNTKSIEWMLHVPVHASDLLFVCGTIHHLFATTSMEIYLATLARSMPQFGMLIVLVLLPLQMLVGKRDTAREFTAHRAGHHAASQVRTGSASSNLFSNGCGLAPRH